MGIVYKLKPEREAEFISCFSSNVEFHYLKGLEKFGDLLDDFKARSNTVKVRIPFLKIMML